VDGDVVTKALSSTNAVFQPNLQDPIILSSRQIETVKRIVGHYKIRSKVRVEKDILPAPEGAFVLGAVRFHWLGNMLYFHDHDANRYYIVEDATLNEMSHTFFEVEGQRPPLQYPSHEQWIKILFVLEKDN
jgi:hypothetical protein